MFDEEAVTMTEQVRELPLPLSVQFVGLKLTPATEEKVTVPVGDVGLGADVSVTVIVKLCEPPTATVAAVGLHVVEVECLVARAKSFPVGLTLFDTAIPPSVCET